MSKTKLKINYLALGDVFSTGMNLETTFFDSGYLVKVNKIRTGYDIQSRKDNFVCGESIPAYFARLINNFSNSELNEYKNYSISEASADLWSFLLGIDQSRENKKEYKRAFAFDESSYFNASAENKKMFKEKWAIKLDEEKYIFTNLISEMKKSNLITFTLGLREIISYSPLQQIITSVLKGSKSFLGNENEAKEILKNQLNIALKKYILIFQKIHEINPNSKIVLLGINKIFERINKSISNEIKSELGSNLIIYINNIFSNFPRRIAEKLDYVDYINTYNKKYWDKKEYIFSESFASPCPSKQGTIELAKQLFLKTHFLPKDIINVFPKYDKFYNEKEFFIINGLPLDKLMIKNIDVYLDNIWNKKIDFTENKFKQISLNWVSTNPNLSKKVWLYLVNIAMSKSKILGQNLESFLINDKNYIDLTRIIVGSNMLQTYVSNIQYELENKEQNNDGRKGIQFLTWSDFFAIIKQNFDPKDLIYGSLKEIYSSFYFVNNQKLLFSFFHDLFIGILCDKELIFSITNKLVNEFLSSNFNFDLDNFERIYNNLIKRKILNEFVEKLSNILVSHVGIFNKPDTDREYIGLFLKNQFKEVVILLFEILEKIINDEKTYDDILGLLNMLFPKINGTIQDPKFIQKFWAIAIDNDDQNIEKLMFKLSEFYSLKFSYQKYNVFSQGEDVAQYAALLTQEMLSYSLATLKKLKRLPDYNLILYWVFSSKGIKNLIINSGVDKYALKRVKISSVLKTIPLVRKNLKLIVNSLFEYCKVNDLLDKYKEIIALLLNISLEITKSINYKKLNSFKSQLVKWLFFVWIKSKNSIENKINKELFNKYKDILVLQREVTRIKKELNLQKKQEL